MCGGWQDDPVPMWCYRIDHTYPPWSDDGTERNSPGLLLFIVDLSALLITDLLLTPTDLVLSLIL